MLKILIFFLGPVLATWVQAVPAEQLYPVTQDSEGLIVAEGRSESTGQNDQARITVTGSRLSEGNAVDCPKIRTDDGQIYSVSYLAPSIAIGDRVVVTGFMAHVTTCRGPVLYAESVVHEQ